MATPTTQTPGGSTPQTPVKPTVGRFRRAYKQFYRIITSHLGLIAFLVAFSFAGAAIFHAIENDNEKDEKADIQWLREQIINRVWNASSAVKRNEQAFRLLMRHEMKKYETQLYAAFGDGINTSTESEVWDFWNSLFYCATIYTTIGYGNIYPATDVGRVFTILYSLVGIPLCLIVLADLGKLFTRAIKWVWSFIRRFYYTRRWSRAGAKKVVEEKADKARQTSMMRGPQIRQAPDTTRIQQTPAPVAPLEPEMPIFVVDDEFNLPVTVAVIITFVYILLGALLYCQWEQWSYLESFYFVFVSLSTIGFGDVLPDQPKYFLLSSIYVLVGLSLVAMVINVIMEAMMLHLDMAQKNMGEIARTVGIGMEEDEMDQSLMAQNGSATKSSLPGTPSQSVSTLNTPTSAGQLMTPTSPRDPYGSTMSSPSGRDDPHYGQQERGRAPYRDRPQDYQGRDGTELRRREPYEYRGDPHDTRRPDDYRGRPEDYRGRPEDYRGPSDYRGPDARLDPRGDPRGDPRYGDRSPDRRMADPRYNDPRNVADRGDPRFDPRSPVDPRTDPRLGDPRMGDPRNDPRMADPRTPRSQPQPGYGPQQSQGRPEFYIS